MNVLSIYLHFVSKQACSLENKTKIFVKIFIQVTKQSILSHMLLLKFFGMNIKGTDESIVDTVKPQSHCL